MAQQLRLFWPDAVTRREDCPGQTRYHGPRLWPHGHLGMICKQLLGVLLLLLSWSPAMAAPLQLTDARQRIDPSPAVRYLIDEAHSFTLEQVLELPAANWAQGPLHFGFSSASYWLRLDLQAGSAAQGEWLLEVANPLLDQADLYVLRGHELYLSQSSGAHLPLAERAIASPRLLFPLHLQPEQPLTLILRVRTQGAAHMPLQLWRSEALLADSDSRSRYQGMLLGVLLVMGLYNLFIYAATRLTVHLWYAGYVLSVAALFSGIFGIAGAIWPALRHPAIVVTGVTALAFAALFADGVMQFKRHLPRARRLIRLLVAANVLLALLTAILPYHISARLLVVIGMLMPLALLAIACWLAWKHIPLARPYVLSWLLLLLGSVLTCALYSGWLQWPIPSYLPLLIGSVGEVILLSAILAWRFALERRSRHRAQQRALDQTRRLRRLRDEQLRLQSNTQRELEQSASERTMELEFALRELQEANQRLEELSTIDSLTGVRNRAYFDKRYIAEQRRSRREEAQLALVMMDIDHFKSVNDRYGHVTGDEVIRTVAQRAAAELKRPGDVLTRYGGEEFALLLPNTSSEGAVAVAEAVRQAVCREAVATPAGPLAISVSLGAASQYIVATTPTSELLERADAALYRAKQAGRNRVDVAPPVHDGPAIAQPQS